MSAAEGLRLGRLDLATKQILFNWRAIGLRLELPPEHLPAWQMRYGFRASRRNRSFGEVKSIVGGRGLD